MHAAQLIHCGKTLKNFEFRHLITPVSLIQGLRQKPGEAEMLSLNFYYDE